MDWTTKIFRYCERGTDPAFWAEPANAISNGAFIIAAIAAAILLAGASRRASNSPVVWLLVAVLFVIGCGSFLFHTYATRWAALADVAPIGIFMFVYLGFALRRFIGLPWLGVAAGLGVFAYAMHVADGIQCNVSLLSITEAARGPCLNGTAAYAPALGAMVVIGAALALMRHRAAPLLLGAAAIFLVSMFFRTIDFEACAMTRFAGHVFGTHFLWHVFNATTLFVLVLAAIRHDTPRQEAAPRAY